MTLSRKHPQNGESRGRVGWSEEVLEDEAPGAQGVDDLFSVIHNEQGGV